MSLHWTIIAGFLYGEIATVLILLLPFISPRTWNKLFKSRFLRGLESQLIYYFYVLVTILILFFLGKIWTEYFQNVTINWVLPFLIKTSPPIEDIPQNLSFRCYSWNAKIWWRTTRDRRTQPWFRTSWYADADAHETFSSPKEFLYFRFCSIFVLGDSKNGNSSVY